MNVELSSQRFNDMVRGTAVNVSQEEFAKALQVAFSHGNGMESYCLRSNYPKAYSAVGNLTKLRSSCKNNGLNPDDHNLKFSLYKNRMILQVDGYWVRAYKVLFTENQDNVSMSILGSVKGYLIALRDYDALALLYAKYGSIFEQREAKYRKRHGLDDKDEIASIAWGKINGMAAKMWLALNYDKYLPQKSTLKYWIRLFEENGETEKSELLREKY